MARVNRLAIGLALALAAAAVQADPVTIIGGIIAYSAAGAAGVALSSIAFAGITYGALAFSAGSLLFGTLNAKRKQKQAAAAQRDQYNASLQDRMVTALSTAAPWQIIYGQAEVGGSLEAILTSGDKDEYKHLVIVFAAHACQEIVDIAINGESLGALDGAGAVTTGKWFKTSTDTHSETVAFDGTGTGTLSVAGATLVKLVSPMTGSGGGMDFVADPEQVFDAAVLTGTTITGGPVSLSAVATYTLANADALVRVKKHLGADDQAADASLLAECADEWSADDRFRGLTYIVVRLKLTEPEFQGGPPAITATIKGKPVYDHRTGLTAWTDNPALCVADFLMAPYGKDARTNQVVWDTVDAAANACDEVVTAGTWTGTRYRCDGAFRTDQDTDQTLDSLLDCMAGWADGGGGWRIGAGVWTAPVATLTDDDNAGAVQIVGGEGLDELFNGVRGQYSDPLRGGVATDFTPYQNAAFVAVDGRPLWLDMSLPWTSDGTRARNLARIAVERSRGETLSFPARLGVLNRMRVGERVLVYCSGLGIAGSTFRLQRRDEEPGRPVMLTLTQDVEANYDTVDAAEPVPGSYVAVPDPFAVPAPVGLSALSGEDYALVAGATVVPRIYVSVTGAPQQVNDQLQVEWRPSAIDDWQALQVPVGQLGGYIEGVSQNVTYFVRARWSRPSIGAFSDWRTTSCKVTAKTTPPAGFDVFTVTVLDSGMRRYAFGYTGTPQPVDWKGAEIRYIVETTGAPDWAAMTPLNAAGQVFAHSPVDTNLPAAGVWTFACRSRDSGGLSTAMNVVNATLGAGPAGLYVGDATPPPTPTGFAVSAALANIFAQHDAPAYVTGHGHQKTRLYGKKYTGGALPTFADAALLAEFTGNIYAYPSTMGTTWRLWIKWVSMDNVESAVAAGGANGLAAATGVIGNTDLGPLIIEAGNLAAGAVDLSKFGAGLQPITVLTSGGVPWWYITDIILGTDKKLYRWDGVQYVASVPAVDVTGYLSDAQLWSISAAKLTGQIVSTQITDGAISTPKLAAGAVTANEIAANTITAAKIAAGTLTATEIAAGAVTTSKLAAGAVTANEIAANTITAGKILAGTLTATELAAGSVTASKIAANAIAVGTAAVQNGAIVNAMIGNAAVDSAKIADAAIVSAKIGTAEVGTLKIAGNAVTVPSGNSASGYHPSASVTLPNGGDLFVTVIGNFLASTGDDGTRAMWIHMTGAGYTFDEGYVATTATGGWSYMLNTSHRFGGLPAGTYTAYALDTKPTGVSVGGASILMLGVQR